VSSGTATLSVDINGATAETVVDNADEILLYDSSVGALRKMTRSNFLAGLGGTVTSVGSGAGLTGGPITGSGTLSVDIIGTTQEATNDDSDSILIYDATAAALRRQTRGDFLAGVSGTVTSVATSDGITGGPITGSGTVSLDFTNLTVAAPATGADADILAIYDASSTAMRQITRGQLLQAIAYTGTVGSGTIQGALDALDLYGLQEWYDRSPAEQIATTDATGFTVRQNGVVANLIYRGLNDVGTTTFSVSRAGVITGSDVQTTTLTASGLVTAPTIDYDNTISGLTATTVKAAIDELSTAGGTGTVTSILTGAGLTGGPITTSGFISLDFQNLTPAGAVAEDADLVAIYDDSAGSMRSVTRAQFLDGLSTKYTRTEVAVAAYNALVTDEIIGVTYTTTGACTITLPQIAALGTTNNHKEFTIVDEGGNSSLNNITVNVNATDTVLGEPSIVLHADYSSITLYSDGSTGWFLK
jgi:hypothetical protein